MSPEWREDERERRARVEGGVAVVAHLTGDRALIGWAKERGLFVRIDRRSKWGNPFRIPRDGDRDAVCDQYTDYLRQSPELMARLSDLTGKVLGCWCYPERCHGDAIVEALNAQKVS